MTTIAIPKPPKITRYTPAIVDPYMAEVSNVVGDTWYTATLSGYWIFMVNGSPFKGNGQLGTRKFETALIQALSTHYGSLVEFGTFSDA